VKEQRVKVFIVEDSIVVRERIVNLLSELKEVEIIGYAREALDAAISINKLKPDVVILDIRLKGGNGIDVLRNIKNYKYSPKIIVLTNYPFPQYRKKCMDAGADFFFDKSTEFDKIIDVLQQMIQESKK
jgi:DNA-binding NarL/FixJ family response regulator